MIERRTSAAGAARRRRRPNRRIPFTGILREPLDPPRPGESSDEASYRVMRERLHKLHALRAHYRLAAPISAETASGDEDMDWMMLALALAEDFVPGFRFRDDGGRAPTADAVVRDLELFQAVRSGLERGKAVSTVCRHLSRRRGGVFFGSAPRTLANRFGLLHDAASKEGQRLRAVIAALAETRPSPRASRRSLQTTAAATAGQEEDEFVDSTD